MPLDSGQFYVREGSYSEQDLNPTLRTVSDARIAGRLARAHGMPPGIARDIVRAAFVATDLTDVGPGGSTGRGQRVYRATAQQAGQWLASYTP